MTWTNLSFPFASLLTSSQMTQLDANFEALAAGDSGAPEIVQAAIKNSTATVSTTSTSGVNLVLSGGQWGFYPRVDQETGGAHTMAIADGDTSLSFVTNIWIIVTGGTGRANQRFIQASPPYNLGDGDIPLFIFALVDSLGNIIAASVASDPPWANNGPTNIKPDFHRNGLGFKRELILPHGLEEAANDIGKLAANQAAIRNPKFREIEITQAIKQADMPLIPHPFIGNDLTGLTPVLIDPVGSFIEDLFVLNNDVIKEGELNSLLHNGNLKIDNVPLDRALPPGVIAVEMKWKVTP